MIVYEGKYVHRHLTYKVVFLTHHLTQVYLPPLPRPKGMAVISRPVPDWLPPHVERASQGEGETPPPGRGGGHPLGNHTWEKEKKGEARAILNVGR